MASEEIAALPIFSGLDREEIDRLIGHFQPEIYAVHQKIFRQGDKADKLHILIDGEVEIHFKPHDGESLVVGLVGAGGVFGWSAALGRRNYTSDAVATKEGRGLSVRGAALRDFCVSYPKAGIILLERLAEVISDRLRGTHEKVVELLQQGLFLERH